MSIELRDLAKAFGTKSLWSGLSRTIEAGRLTAITGPSGSGKSTLLNAIGLLEPTSGGSIVVEGANIAAFRRRLARRFRRDKLGYLFQNYALVEDANIAYNLAIASGGGRRVSREAMVDALARVGLAGREPVFQLSGGEQQRVALARLLVKDPAIVLADEPTGALDSDNAAMVVDELRRFASEGRTVVVATHSPFVVANCDDELRLGTNA